MADWFRKTPCEHCPYRRDVKPFLTPERGEELAFHSTNPYNSFPCHKTTEEGEDGFEMVAVETSQECAGFLSMVVNENGNEIEGFTPSGLVYSDAWEMCDAYAEQR